MNRASGQFDERWRSSILAGEPQAVEELADAMLGPLYGFCLYRVGGNHHLCEEVVQETMLVAIDRVDRYEPARARGDIFPWVTGLARNEISRVLARERMTSIKAGGPTRRLSFETLWEHMDSELLAVLARLESHPIEDDILVRRETRELVGMALCQLPPRYRAALEARYVAESSLRQVAEAMGITEKAVESLLARARQAFKSAFLALTSNVPATLA